MEDEFSGDIFGDVDDLLFDFPSSYAPEEPAFGPLGSVEHGAGPTHPTAVGVNHRTAPTQDEARSPSSSAADHGAADSRAKRKAVQNRCDGHVYCVSVLGRLTVVAFDAA